MSKAEASEKIQSRINTGKQLTEISATSKDDLTNLKHETRKWCDYNKTLFDTLFDISPLPDSHGVSGWGRMVWIIGRDYTADDIKDHKERIISWCNQLQSILEQLDLYEETTPIKEKPRHSKSKSIAKIKYLTKKHLIPFLVAIITSVIGSIIVIYIGC